MSAYETGNNAQNLAGLDAESRQMVLDTLQLVRERLLPKSKLLELDKKEIFPEEILREMLGPEIGLQLLFIPEAYGGMGGGARDSLAITREMSKICLGVATAFFAIQLGADPIMFAGTEEQKQKWLGKISEGGCLVAYAVTEAEAGSNLGSLKTKAEPVVDGSGHVTGYKITGSKQFISNGGYADFLTVLARAPEGPSFFVVEKGMPGFQPGKSEEKHGIRAANTSPLTFEDVFVPIENLLGGVPGIGLKQANMVFGHTRLMVAALGIGAGESALELMIRYAKERIQFGTPLSEKQGYTHKLVVPNAVRLEAAVAYAEEQALRLDSGEIDLQVEGSIAKYFGSEAANKTSEDAIQGLGGYGYINEYEVEKIKRDVKITTIYEGTSEIQQSIISIFRWKKTLKTKGLYYGRMAEEMEALARLHPDMGAGIYAKAARSLNDVILFANAKGLTKQQHVMFCLADMMTYTEIGVSTAKKAKALRDAHGPDAGKMALAAKIFAAETADVIAKNTIKIVCGSAEGTLQDIHHRIDEGTLAESSHGIIKDMDAFADILFGRA